MKTKKKNKLTINRETMNRLAEQDLIQVAGGSGQYGPGCISEWPNCNTVP